MPMTPFISNREEQFNCFYWCVQPISCARQLIIWATIQKDLFIDSLSNILVIFLCLLESEFSHPFRFMPRFEFNWLGIAWYQEQKKNNQVIHSSDQVLCVYVSPLIGHSFKWFCQQRLKILILWMIYEQFAWQIREFEYWTIVIWRSQPKHSF